MNDSDRASVIEAVERWAETHPLKEQSVITFGSSVRYSPLGIVAALRSGTPEGEQLFRIIEQGAERYSLADVLRSFEGTSGIAKPATAKPGSAGA